MELGKQKIVYSAYILLILFIIFTYGIQKVCCFTLFPDEFGYWASAAKIAGYDWSDMTALGSYYSFGYGFLLFPVLKISFDGIVAYRAAIGLNVALMCVSFFLAQGIVRDLFPETNEVQRVFISGIALFYPPWIFYMQMTMTETLLTFLFIVLLKLLISLIRRPGVRTVAGLAVLITYMYSVHMRTAGLAISSVIVLCLWGKEQKNGKKYLLCFFIILMLTGAMAVGYKRYTVSEVFPYVEPEALKTNDYEGIWSKFTEIFSTEGIIHFSAGLLGKIFYMGLSSFGFVFWSIIWCLRGVSDYFRKRMKGITELHEWIALFILLAVVSEILISTVYMVREKSIDSLVYGRYIDFLVPALMMTGICMAERSKFFLRLSLLWGALSGGMALLLLALIDREKRTGIRGYMTVGISQFIKESSFEPYVFFLMTWMVGFILLLGLGMLIRLSCKVDNMNWLMGGFIVAEVALGLYASHHYTYRYNETHFVDKAVAEVIRERADENKEVFYLKEDDTKYIEAVQMMLGEQQVKVIEEEEFVAKEHNDDFLLTVSWSSYKEELRELYENNVEVNTFILFYNSGKQTNLKRGNGNEKNQ